MTNRTHLGRTDIHFPTSHPRAEFGVPVDLEQSDRQRHMLISGRSGTGKSTLLANIFRQDAEAGRAVVLLDPHGDLAVTALALVPRNRLRKTIYFNLTDHEHPIAFNVLAAVPPDQRALRASNIVAAFHAVWHDSWGPRLEHILYNTLVALMDAPSPSLFGIARMLLDASYRALVLEHVRDPVIAQFWRLEFPLYEKKFGIEAVSPILNKIGQFLGMPAIRNVLCQPVNAFSPRHLIDHNYVVVVNLSKGQLGEHHANLVGALLVSSFGAAVMARADTPEDQRKDVSMIIDEFQNYATLAFATLLAEARKYRLSLTLAHQYLAQLSEPVRAAALGNVGSLITFRIGPEDAAAFALAHSLTNPDRLMRLANFEACARLLSYDAPTISRILRCASPPRTSPAQVDVLIRHSRIHYASAREHVEFCITRDFAKQPLPPKMPSQRHTPAHRSARR